jgi:Ubiquinol-cytochrome C reductase complex 14kD subunit
LFTDKVEEFKEALSFVHPDVRVGRMRRTRRAIDLDFKHKNFDDYAPNVDQETFKFEIFDYMNRIRAREYEKSVLSKS